MVSIIEVRQKELINYYFVIRRAVCFDFIQLTYQT
jgi:hypothetical protein